MSTSEKVELVLVEINFERIPTIREAFFGSRLFFSADWQERLIWFPALWAAGRYAHVYFAYQGVPYHVSNLKTSDLRHEYNTQKRYAYSYHIWVPKENLLRAMVCVEEANKNHWSHLWLNCTNTISELLYGNRTRYGVFGTSFGAQTRRVLRDVQNVALCQNTL